MNEWENDNDSRPTSLEKDITLSNGTVIHVSFDFPEASFKSITSTHLTEFKHELMNLYARSALMIMKHQNNRYGKVDVANG